MKKRNITLRLNFNSPVILSIMLISLCILGLNALMGDRVNRFLAVYYTSWTDPLMYVRLFTHILTHQNFAHYSGNFLLILAVGPIVEEKYGGGRLLTMILITAAVTGLINVIFFKHIMLLGASGIVFMLIVLASFVNIREGTLPVTVLLVALLFIGNEIVVGLTARDNISQMGHIIGGLCGAGFGAYRKKGK